MQFKVANAYLSLFPVTPTLPPVASNPGDDGVYVTLDQWDGYQAERDEIIEKVGEQWRRRSKRCRMSRTS
jgi:hypothetical protein